MKTMFVSSAATSGVVSFFLVRAYRKHEQKKFDRKMVAVDNWINRSK